MTPKVILPKAVIPKDWIVISGRLLDTTKGGGLEFLGPFTDQQAHDYAQQIRDRHRKDQRVIPGDTIVLAVQLLKVRT